MLNFDSRKIRLTFEVVTKPWNAKIRLNYKIYYNYKRDDIEIINGRYFPGFLWICPSNGELNFNPSFTPKPVRPIYLRTYSVHNYYIIILEDISLYMQ